MLDYGRPLQFGLSLSPKAEAWSQTVATAQEAEKLGLEFVGIQDHPYQHRFLDTMMLLASVVSHTQHLRVFPDVACLPLRHPAMLAKEAASIDVLSGGRFELGLGAGAFWDAIVAMDGPRRAPGESLQALKEAVEIMQLQWTGKRGARYDGDHYSVDGLHPGPVPAHNIKIWLGVGGPRALRLLGQVGDGWLPSIGGIPVKELNSRHAIIDEAAEEAGRNPAEIRRLANINGTITAGKSRGFLHGPETQWIEQITGLAVEHGIDTFVFSPGEDPLTQTRRFADVTSAIRSAISHERT